MALHSEHTVGLERTGSSGCRRPVPEGEMCGAPGRTRVGRTRGSRRAQSAALGLARPGTLAGALAPSAEAALAPGDGRGLVGTSGAPAEKQRGQCGGPASSRLAPASETSLARAELHFRGSPGRAGKERAPQGRKTNVSPPVSDSRGHARQAGTADPQRLKGPGPEGRAQAAAPAGPSRSWRRLRTAAPAGWGLPRRPWPAVPPATRLCAVQARRPAPG